MKNIEDIYPLSGMQEGILFHIYPETQSEMYVEQASWTIESQFNPAFFESAWRDVISRHPVLRTCFVIDNVEKPLQVVRQEVEFSVISIDWRRLPEDECQKQLQKYFDDDRRRGFVLRQAPLLRVTAIYIEERRWRILWSWHHLILDGWSASLVLNEVFTVYTALSTGQAIPRSRTGKYRDYITWLLKQDLSSAELYWREYLRGFEPAPLTLGLPEEARSSKIDYPTQSLRISRTATDHFNEYVRAQRVTLNCMVQVAWALVLSRYSGTCDVLFGAVASGRSIPLEGIETIPGVFVNTLPSRIDVAAHQSLSVLLQRTQADQLKARSFEHLSLGRIQKWSGIQAGQPFFDSLLVFKNLPAVSASQIHGQNWGNLTYSFAKTGYLLTLEVFPEDELGLQLTFHRSRLDAAAAERLLSHLHTILLSISGAILVEDVEMLTPAERRQLLLEWNTGVKATPPFLLHELIRDQAARTPGAIAVVFEHQQITYAELDAQSDRLAASLAQLGAGPERIVAVCAERSLELVKSLLAILKTGAAYVPLDPSYPTSLLTYMLEDCKAAILLAQRQAIPLFAPAAGACIVCLEDVLNSLESGSFAPPRLSPDCASYAIYTSGTTGKPKAALNRHAAIVNRLLWMQDEYRLTPADCVLQKTPMSFDVSVWEFFWPLLCGARLAVAPPGAHREPAWLKELIISNRITTLHFVPSMMQAFLQEPDIESCSSLRQVFSSGEALTAELCARFQERLTAKLYNLYGPTEAAVDVTSRDCSVHTATRTVPIGRPICNVVARILSPNFDLVPVGVPGELVIGGVALARGYLNRPELTAERFVPDPYSSVPGTRLYRTGDQARYLPDGEIEFLGRLDHQIKLRGFRIEPGEIESCMRLHPAVNDAVVVLHTHIHPQLVAYYIPRMPEIEDPANLREFLSGRLPDHMVPASFVRMDSWPVSPSGKLDRRLLPVPNPSVAQTSGPIPARTPVEKTLSAIWSKVLGITDPRVFDNFFELGGDSIQAMLISARARQAGLKLSPRDVIDRQTISALAAFCQPFSGLAPREAPPVEASLSPIQSWFFEHWGEQPDHFNQAIILEIEDIALSTLARALDEVVHRHGALSLRFFRHGNSWKQIQAAHSLSLCHIDLDAVPDDARLSLFNEVSSQLQQSLNFTSGPLLRASRFSFGASRPDVLLLIVHHLAVDGVSWRILFEDLEAALQQAHDGVPVALPVLGTTFLEWAKKMDEHAKSPGVLAHAEYWNALAERCSSLPLDFDRGPNSVASEHTIWFTLDSDETAALVQRLPGECGVSIDQALVSALATVLAGWTQKQDVSIALEAHGRDSIFDDLDISRTVGWFTALYPVLLQLPGLELNAEVLHSVRKQLLAVPDGGISYGLLRMDNKLGNSSSFREPQVLFNYFGQFDQVLAQSSFRISELDGGPLRSKTAIRPFWIEVNCGIRQGRLHCGWAYSSNLHTELTMEQLSRKFHHELSILAQRCRPTNKNLTVSDFPLSSLTPYEFGLLLSSSPDLEDLYALTPLQEGLLSHHLHAPESDLYFEQCTFTVEGSLNCELLKRAWQMTLERHPVLRTSFAWKELGKPVQIVHGKIVAPVEELDWSYLEPLEQAAQRRELLASDLRRSFDPEVAPLLRLSLARQGGNSWFCLLSYHHLLLDGWSLLLVVREILLHYQALVSRNAPKLQPAPSYRDYVAWILNKNEFGAERYWRENLRGVSPSTLLFGTTRGSATDPASAEAYEEHCLEAVATDLLLKFTRSRRVTLSTVLRAAWALLVGRWNGSDDVVFGATISYRPPALPRAEDIVGLFINTVPVRIKIVGTESVGSWLSRLQAEQVELLDYSVTPLSRIQTWSDVPRTVPLFENVLVFQNYRNEMLSDTTLGDLRFTGLKSLQRSTWPLMLVVEPGDKLRLRLIYNSHRFDRSLILRILQQMDCVLREIQLGPSRPLRLVSILTESERHQLLVEWNATSAPWPREACYHHLFEAQAQRTPHALAVAFHNHQLSYRELNEQANRIARFLRSLGAAPETTVGVCLERSTNLVTGRLAVLKAGAAYLPLDPGLPFERLAFMIHDARAAVLLTQESLHKRFAGLDVQTLCLDCSLSEISAQSGANLEFRMSPQNLAYVIYTSGSSGQPKGVATEHAGFVNLVHWHNQAYGITAADRKSQLSGLGFDASVWEMWPYLATGASVHIPDNTTRLDWPKLQRWMVEQRISVTFLPTPLAEEVIDADWPAEIALRAVLTGGDRLSHWPQRPLKFDFVNKYGPTEVTAVTTWAPFRSRSTDGSGVPPIGKPISNLQVYVLDGDQQLVPVGASGELYVGGVGLARGYYNRPDLTAEKFVPNPFGFEPGLRLYRTGDCVRWSPCGELEFLGRLDNQVKIRGFRIELGEIEAALAGNPIVRKAVVLVRTLPSGGETLVAYVVPEDKERFQVEEIRRLLGQTLPLEMVPSFFVVLESFPLTSNGKIDRRALPEPDLAGSSGHVPPRTPTERLLGEIWGRVLGVERVGIRDNFFALGGDSIMSVRICAAARQIGVELAPGKITEFPTIVELAEHIDLPAKDILSSMRSPETANAAAAKAQISSRELEMLGLQLAKRS